MTARDGSAVKTGPKPVANQRDVAKAAGVSISTVSRAFSNSPGISEDLRRRILQLAAELGYERRGAVASVVQTVIAVIRLETFSGDASGFYTEIVEAIETELERAGVEIEMMFLDGPSSGADEIVARAIGHPDLGALVIGIDNPDLLRAVKRSCRAALVVNGIDPEMRLDGVAPANRRGAFLATRLLLELGHRRILHVTALRRQTIQNRLSGYRAALEAHGVDYDPALIVNLPNLHPDAASAAIRSRLADKGLDASAVFCASDMVAVGVIRALAEAGMDVPGQCSVVGFDNTRITSRAKPGLTTINIDTAEIGRQSVRRLMERLREPNLTPISIEIGCNLVERDSARAIVRENNA